MNDFELSRWFKFDTLSVGIVLGIVVFFLLTFVYSIAFMRDKSRGIQYYLLLFLTAVTSIGAVAANNLIVLMVCWGFLGLLLYLLINMGDEDSPKAAKKSFVIVGGCDALMIVGVGIMYHIGQSMQMDALRIEFNSPAAAVAYVCIAVGCFAKAGAMPFHSWIPDCAESAPLPVTAYLPASLDKLLGIYLLARASLSLFVMNQAMNIFLMLVGIITIIAAVMMALVQHNLKKLLGYHAVSQVGYMVLGIGTGSAIGIAGGIFHMLNNAVYKSCLFFTAGNVEYRNKTLELDRLGGLAKYMPITYLCAVIASFSISGIPPFNGFVSKWMIYQGIITGLSNSDNTLVRLVYVMAIIAAMFGSVLTLASFMKMLHAVFLGQRITFEKKEAVKEVPWLMWLPCVALAVICVLLGVFAFGLPLKYFIFPALLPYRPLGPQDFTGTWSPVIATGLVLMGLFIGLAVFYFSKLQKSSRSDATFVGGESEKLREDQMISGVEFYNSIKEYGFLNRMYKYAEKGVFDIYVQAKKVFIFSRVLQYLHNGVLPTYLVWMLLGMVGLFIVIVR